MNSRAMHKLLDLAQRLPSVELLDSTEISPLLEAARAIKAAQGDLEQICLTPDDLPEELWHDLTGDPGSDREMRLHPASDSFSPALHP